MLQEVHNILHTSYINNCEQSTQVQEKRPIPGVEAKELPPRLSIKVKT